jgi:hypothetical protein
LNLPHADLNDGKIYAPLDYNFHNMRHIVAVLIALLALVPLTYAQNNTDALVEPAQMTIDVTPSMAAFLSDDWIPPAYTPTVIYADAVNKKGYLANTTSSRDQFLNDSWVPNSTASLQTTADTALAVGKDGKLKKTEYAIMQFLDDNWTPGTPVYVVETAPYKKGQMS